MRILPLGRFPKIALAVVVASGAAFGLWSGSGSANGPPLSAHRSFLLGAPRGLIASARVLPARDHYSFRVIYSFQNGPDGGSPNAGNLIFDETGGLYGSTESGGKGIGVVFKLTPGASDYTESVLHSFRGPDGALPFGGLLANTSGTLYGTTFEAGPSACGGSQPGCGTAFKLTPSRTRYTVRVLYGFGKPPDGGHPLGVLLVDKPGALYGTTLEGGKPGCAFGGGCGTVFKLTPSRNGYSESILHRFKGGDDGANPYSDLSAGQNGVIYGMTEFGGNKNLGVVFKLTPSGSRYTESVIHSFRGYPTDGANPVQSALIPDGNGALYGSTTLGGSRGFGALFKLTPTKTGFSQRILYSFRGHPHDGQLPYLSFIDESGDLYGVTAVGGTANAGTIYELRPSASGYSERVLYNFQNGSDGIAPLSLTVDKEGALYGMTGEGGACLACGVVFKLTPTSFGSRR